MSRLLAALSLLLPALATPVPARAAPAPGEWWDPGWEYRLVVKVPPPGLRGGINTAAVELAEQSRLCAEGGKDIRVLAQNRTKVPHRVESTQGGGLRVQFHVPPQVERFFLYYGNPRADATRHRWEKKLGGLTLETRRLPRTYHPYARLPSLLKRNLPSFGSGARSQINDLANPFGPNNYYLSIYEGTIYCPEEGRYTFAVNADDLASFRLLRGERSLVHCWRKGGVPSERWRDPDRPDSVKTTPPLGRGVYRISYLHVENRGAQLVKLGWKPPSSGSISTVPARAFVRFLPVWVEGRQKRGSRLNPYFVSRHRYNLVAGEKLRFPNFRLESRTVEGPGGGMSYSWDFGDGHSGQGPVVEHEFPDMGPLRVTLTVQDGDGARASVTRTITPDPEPIRRMSLRMQLNFQKGLPILPAGGSAPLELYLKNEGSVRRDLVLETVVLRGDPRAEPARRSRRLIRRLEATGGQETGWLPVQASVPPSEQKLYLTFRLLLHGRAVAEKQVAALSTAAPLGTLTLDPSHNLRDEAGRLVVLRLADVKLPSAPPRRLENADSSGIDILVLDGEVAGNSPGTEGASYLRILARSLQRSHPALSFSVRRPHSESGGDLLPIQRFLQVRRRVLEERPGLVVLLCRPETVVNAIPPHSYEACLVATLDQVLSRTRAHVLLATPPPLPRPPGLARTYARIIKEVALRKGLPVADLYSRFMLEPRWQELFKPYAPGASRLSPRPSYMLFPNRLGQKKIAAEITRSLEAALGGQLAAAARRSGRSSGTSAGPTR